MFLVACGGSGSNGEPPNGGGVSSNVAVPTANFTLIAQGGLVKFDAQLSSDVMGTITGYAWNFGDDSSPSNTASGVTTSHNYSSEGNYSVLLTVTDDQGATAQKRQGVTIVFSKPVATGKINDTGVTNAQCVSVVAGQGPVISDCLDPTGTATPAQNYLATQDGMLGRDAFSKGGETEFNSNDQLGFSFTKLSATGQAVPYKTQSYDCLKDNVTGLIWEVKTSTTGLRSASSTFTNLDSTTQDQRGNGITPTLADLNAVTNTVGYIKAVNGQGLCGANDWRLPTTNELQSIVDYGKLTGPAVPGAFQKIQNGSYWTAVPDRNDVRAAHSVNLETGEVSALNSGNFVRPQATEPLRVNTLYVLLVRGEKPVNTASRFSTGAAGFGEVVDTFTGLTWKRCPEAKPDATDDPSFGFKKDAITGVELCSSNRQGYLYQGFGGIFGRLVAEAAKIKLPPGPEDVWRLPNLKEMLSIADISQANPIDLAVFPGADQTTSFFTSTPIRGSSTAFWKLNMIRGTTEKNESAGPYQLWLVKGRAR